MSAPIRMAIADSGAFEKVFVELSSPYDPHGGDFDWGIVSQDELPLTLILYGRPNGKPIVFNLDEMIAALQRAKQALLGSSST